MFHLAGVGYDIHSLLTGSKAKKGLRVETPRAPRSIRPAFRKSNIFYSDIPNLQGLQNLTGLKIYPNPNTGEFIIEIKNLRGFENLVGLGTEIKLLNTIGQVIYVEKLDKIKGAYQTKIDMSAYPKGIYTLRIISNEGVINKKIVVE